MKEIRIYKPLYSHNNRDFVNVRLSELLKSRWVRIITPNGERECLSREWIRTGRRTEQVFRFKDSPMKMVGNYVPHYKTEAEEKQQSLDLLREAVR